jgi:hypothetical protein
MDTNELPVVNLDDVKPPPVPDFSKMTDREFYLFMNKQTWLLFEYYTKNMPEASRERFDQLKKSYTDALLDVYQMYLEKRQHQNENERKSVMMVWNFEEKPPITKDMLLGHSLIPRNLFRFFLMYVDYKDTKNPVLVLPEQPDTVCPTFPHLPEEVKKLPLMIFNLMYYG